MIYWENFENPWQRPRARKGSFIGMDGMSRNAFNFWSFNDLNKDLTRNPFKSYSNSGSEDADSSVDSFSPFASPVGSPQSYSPTVWPQSVHSFKRQTITKSLLFDEDINELKSDFESNGKEVPLNRDVERAGMQMGTDQYSGQYQLFGRNGFNYAQMRPIVGQRCKPFESGFQPKAKRKQKSQMFCTFCKNNNETPDCYNSHVVKDLMGRTTCPVLRALDCPICHNGGGDNGHTLRYCPLNKPDSDRHIPSVIKLLKNSRSSDGRKRSIE